MSSSSDQDKDYRELLSLCCKDILNNSEVKFSPSNNLKINSTAVNHTNIAKFWLELCKEKIFEKYFILINKAPSVVSFFEDFRRCLKLTQIEIKRLNSQAVASNYNIVDFDYADLLPIISIEDSNKTLFINIKTRQIAKLDYQTYKETTPKEFLRTPIRCIVEFNPYNPAQIYTGPSSYGPTCSFINTYQRPSWQKEKQLTTSEILEYKKLPQIFEDFFNHLFPDKDCREFVFDWLHYALTLRCETYLVLNGAKGIGKNLFTEHLCPQLLGKENHKFAPPGALESQFNAMLVDCRMIVFDEFTIDSDDKINKLKRYINEDQSIEFKGVDVGKTRKTFNSFIISNNKITDIKIYWDDRRFSVADLTSTRLEDVWDKPKRQLFVDSCKDPQIMRELGYYLMYREPTSVEREFTAYKGKHFWKLCYNSLPEWFKVIVEECQNTSELILERTTLSESYRQRNPQGRFPQAAKVEDFILNYKHNGEHSLGKFVKDGNSYYIEINPEIKNITKDTTGIDWNLLGGGDGEASPSDSDLL